MFAFIEKDCYRKCMREYDYLEDTPDAERTREESAPSLSSRFLRESVNAEQRKIIVGYLIHLGVSALGINTVFNFTKNGAISVHIF